MNGRYIHAHELLSSVRAQVLLASVYVRDALLDPDPATAEDYRRELEGANQIADRALEQYVPVLDSPDEVERVKHLRREIDAFRETLHQVLATDSSRWPPNPTRKSPGRTPARDAGLGSKTSST
jgi:hypothetical protein